MNTNAKMSPQEWLDWQLRDFHGYKDLDELQSCLLSSYAKIEAARLNIQKYTSSEFAGMYNREDIQRNEDRIEWALELKTLIEKEIADFPPLPVLPPPGPLEKISGVIEEVTFTKAMACFDAEAYSTMKDELERKRNRDNAGAAITMIAQALSDTAPHALINDGKANKLKCLYVKGKISGKPFSGWFGMTNIRPGDFVEMAVAKSDEQHITYAIANPKTRIISVTPKCNEGMSANSFCLSLLFFLVLFLIPFMYPFLCADAFLEMLLFYIGISLFVTTGVYMRTKKERGCQYLLYESLASALTLPKENKFNLIIITAKTIKEKIANGTYIPREESELPLPQRASKGGLYEYFYYY